MALNFSNAMPPFFQFSNDDGTVARQHEADDGAPAPPSSPSAREPHKQNMWGRLNRLSTWLKKDSDEDGALDHGQEQGVQDKGKQSQDGPNQRPSFMSRRGSRKVIPGLPRPITFRRQQSEMRDRLEPNQPSSQERRAQSADRKTVDKHPIKRSLSPPPMSMPSTSAPDLREMTIETCSTGPIEGNDTESISDIKEGMQIDDDRPELPPPAPPPPLATADDFDDRRSLSEASDDFALRDELEAKWILNLSMHFRDRSDREKFWVTYAEHPDFWRRVTISCDYRGDLDPGSMEANLRTLPYQRDKSACIYEAIRDSLGQIHFYDTVTNLKLETRDGRLHVHVTEDVNEIIPYPPTSVVSHLACPRFPESQVRFDSHLSGFVYKVQVNGHFYIKKEIPGPDQVEEFLYEINALDDLRGSQSVINFVGLVVDENSELVKGILIDVAEKGTLVDILYDTHLKGAIPWKRRERWAKQIVQGLSEIHETGYVQGDFTLSNIVIDAGDDAKIIDINRRGCPVGWEPPELEKKIQSGQRISMHIGVKSDLFQLGMVLWAIAEQQDEPERQERPLRFTSASEDVPDYFRGMVASCLSDHPRNRASAKDLLGRFPEIDEQASRPPADSLHSLSERHSSPKQYIDPDDAVKLEDIDQYRNRRSQFESDFSTGELTFADGPGSTEYAFNSSGSLVIGHKTAPRRRHHVVRSTSPPYTHASSAPSLGECDVEPDISQLPTAEPAWDQISVDGHTHLVDRNSFDIGTPDIHSTEGTVKEESSTLEPTPRARHVALNVQNPQRRATIGYKPDSPSTPSTVRQRVRWSADDPRPREPSFHERMLELGKSTGEKYPGLDDLVSNLSFLKSVQSTPLHQESSSLRSMQSTPGFNKKLRPRRHPSASLRSMQSTPLFGPPVHQDSGFDEVMPQTIDEPGAGFGHEAHLEDRFPDRLMQQTPFERYQTPFEQVPFENASFEQAPFERFQTPFERFDSTEPQLSEDFSSIRPDSTPIPTAIALPQPLESSGPSTAPDRLPLFPVHETKIFPSESVPPRRPSAPVYPSPPPSGPFSDVSSPARNATPLADSTSVYGVLEETNGNATAIRLDRVGSTEKVRDRST